jgi:hypothetical protein
LCGCPEAAFVASPAGGSPPEGGNGANHPAPANRHQPADQQMGDMAPDPIRYHAACATPETQASGDVMLCAVNMEQKGRAETTWVETQFAAAAHGHSRPAEARIRASQPPGDPGCNDRPPPQPPIGRPPSRIACGADLSSVRPGSPARGLPSCNLSSGRSRLHADSRSTSTDTPAGACR